MFYRGFFQITTFPLQQSRSQNSSWGKKCPGCVERASLSETDANLHVQRQIDEEVSTRSDRTCTPYLHFFAILYTFFKARAHAHSFILRNTIRACSCEMGTYNRRTVTSLRSGTRYRELEEAPDKDLDVWPHWMPKHARWKDHELTKWTALNGAFSHVTRTNRLLLQMEFRNHQLPTPGEFFHDSKFWQ